jgi:quercetin dioxygenase-like cupin family protein
MRIANTLVLVLALGLTSGLAMKVQTALAREEPELPHAFDAGWEGQKTCELLFADDRTRVARCVFPPGIGHEKHYHKPHFGYVLEGGTLRIADSTGERVVTTEPGGSWSTTTITVHEAMNIGDTTTSYLIVEPITP